MSPEERHNRRIGHPGFWALPTKNTRDRATSIMPKLLYERLDEFGLDFTVLYPSAGLGLPLSPDAEQRAAARRAFNTFSADYFSTYADRITPAAVIPMHPPEEAIAELEHAVTRLGSKVVMLGSLATRPTSAPDAATVGPWRDVMALDSDQDYDPVWAKCVELKVAPSFHSDGRGFAMRLSPNNFTYNYIGHFAAANEAVCKALFIGGVTHRFPQLKFAFLEGGVGWACQLYVDLIEHWEKRNIYALDEVNPANLDGTPIIAEVLRRREAKQHTASPPKIANDTGGLTNLDDYSACAISRAQDIKALFNNNFYFGCEADDRMNAWAFNRHINPFGAEINALFGSDIGHFDVPNMAEVLPKAYGFVEEGLMTADNFRDFVCTNPVRFWDEANPEFFKGTSVEAPAAAVLTGNSAEPNVNGHATGQSSK